MIRAVFFDADGVLYRGEEPVQELIEVIKVLQQEGIQTFVLTNNSTKSRAQYMKRLQEMGIPFSKERIISSAFMVAELISSEKDHARVFVIGEEGLKEELREHGHKVLEGEEELADFVVVGLDREFNYEKLMHGQYHVLHGARFFATNTDASLPGSERVLPGAGSMVSALETCTGSSPELIAGKPSRFVFQKALRLSGVKPHEAVMVGDRYETDIQGALNAGVNAFIALTGVTSKEQAQALVSSRDATEPWVKVLWSARELLRVVRGEAS